jgi:hypothetical protein
MLNLDRGKALFGNKNDCRGFTPSCCSVGSFVIWKGLLSLVLFEGIQFSMHGLLMANLLLALSDSEVVQYSCHQYVCTYWYVPG